MRHVDEFDMEGADIEFCPAGEFLDGNLSLLSFFDQFSSKQSGGEWRGIERGSEARPEPHHGPEMIFMGVG